MENQPEKKFGGGTRDKHGVKWFTKGGRALRKIKPRAECRASGLQHTEEKEKEERDQVDEGGHEEEKNGVHRGKGETEQKLGKGLGGRGPLKQNWELLGRVPKKKGGDGTS